MSRNHLFILITLAGLASCTAHVEDTRPGQPVKTRQDAFKEILRVFEPMGVMLRTDRYDSVRFAELAAELSGISERPWVHFSADTNYPPSKAKDAVWKQPDEFERKKLAFSAAITRLDSAVTSAKKEGISKAYFELHDTCKSCHDQFKKR